MVSWAIREFGGEIPKKDPRTLPEFAAEAAWNCDMSSGVLAGLPIPEKLIDLSATAGTKRAYRFPVDGLPDAWLPLPSVNSSVCRSPLANDTTHRLYWTNPPGSSNPGSFWNTYGRIMAGTAPYVLGTVQPAAGATLTVTAAGGTSGTSVPYIARSYVWTSVNQYGEESAPCLPSTVVAGASDGTWTISGLPTVVPVEIVFGSFPETPVNYPPITGINLYRTSTGATTGAQFYRVAQFVYGSTPPPSSYVDTVADSVAVGNLTLISASWANPPAGLDGLTSLPGGMMVGFTGNTIHFCEPDRPHAWPAGYDQSMQYPIAGLGLWQQSLMVLTHGFPSTGSGNSPSNYVFSQVRVPEPCVSRSSILTDLMGVYYASQNGLVMLNYYGMQNQTLSMMDKNIWLNDFKAESIIACRHRAQYLAILNDGSGKGFMIDYADAKLGIVRLNTFANATCVWNDEYTGDAYICAGGVVYRWDSPHTGHLPYRWRSRQFYGAAPINIGAVQISLEDDVETYYPQSLIPLTNGDPLLVLPDRVNAIFNIYAGDHLVFSKHLTRPRETFSLPSGFKAFNWQCEVISRVAIKGIELASTFRELRNV